MNFLAHLHIAEHTKTSLLGNFLGDFIKGNPQERFAHEVVQGIRLHRFVDSYTDSHSLVKLSKPMFNKDLRRFSPIALDMFWDHCLAKHWSLFHHSSLTDFSLQAQFTIQKEIQQLSQPLPVEFIKVSESLWEGKWFEHYTKIENIDFALRRIALRRPRMAPLADTFSTLSSHYDQLSEMFFELYPDILLASTEAIKKETN